MEQQRHWRAYLLGAARLTEALSRQLEHDSGLSLSEYEVMVRLSEAPDRTVRMAELAASLVHSRSRLTHTVSRMEQRGLVERRACLADGRGINAVLTEAGWAALVAAAPGHVRAVREHLVDRLTDTQLRALGEAMAAAAPDVAQR
ncbi:MAG TPA: helix-turn-helix domain-containing protein [Actinotalea sp.]|nr:helix-turn-helix domain-containing protein [Actinotalea sp.]